MIRLATKTRKDLLKDTKQHLAPQTEAETNRQQAQDPTPEGSAWHRAGSIYPAPQHTEGPRRVAQAP